MNKKAFVLVASTFLVLFLGIFMSFSLLRMSVHFRAIELKRASLRAFCAAETGVETAITQLRQNHTWRDGYVDQPLTWEQDGESQVVGYYTVQIAEAADVDNINSVWIQSIGRDDERKTLRVIVARAIMLNPAENFISSASDLTLGSGVTINGSILSRDVTFSPNFLYSDPDQRRITVNGDVRYVNEVNGEESADVVVTGDVRPHPPVTFSSLDFHYYDKLAKDDGARITGGPAKPVSGEINWANLKTQNGVVYVEGDLYISGTVSESILFVVNGSVYIENNLTCQTVDGQKSQIGLVAKNDVFLSSAAPADLSVDAFVLADGGVFKAQGLPGTKNSLNFTGSIGVRGRLGEPTSVSLNVYKNRTYDYDHSLSDSLSIPFMSYLVNFFTWQEVLATDVFPPE